MNLRKYLVMGSQNCEKNPAAILESAISAGITAFQFREKGKGSLTGNDKLKLGFTLRLICSRHNIPFIVNDDLDLVEPLEADGIHVGQDDQAARKVRAAFPDKLLGLSVSNQTEVSKSPIELVDYLGAGPIFQTSSKEDAKQPVGPSWIKELRKDYPHLPIVGIGGINETNAASVMEAGADGVAVISAITKAEDIHVAVQQL
ncbi:thiamine phosphate synthase [Virgibacillus siamensis]|uniref:thiamine phosphate synthase n=1 Tax=Virgibacillus siamensis TaxID=480071 RepID=UPI00098573CB|nr:thiamine phosphate synthase [Virgibacillus siamensis]